MEQDSKTKAITSLETMYINIVDLDICIICSQLF